ncbi:PFU-domain-containing protein [Testicularia cyperi]|uniref:PFU-domain-containing protein n=1 Tax=Testicularia cyperi TaxID=1882483 RepID=A0A317XPW1_9BASI|nr:PFU-domain-containing protein [Testicularia cyperi]
MAAASSSSYKLSATLEGHEGDVRCVAASTVDVQASIKTDLILTASRDQKAIVWSRASPTSFQPAAAIDAHTGFVNACTFTTIGGDVYAVTAGQDKTIYAHWISEHNGAIEVDTKGTRVLVGHEDNVCALDSHPDGSYLLSGSWDSTAKVWKGWECIATLKGHQQSVWAVLGLDHDRVLTASADRTIRLWSISRPSQPLAVFGGHADAVRGLTLLEGGQSFASCSNDGNINLYSLVDVAATGPSSSASKPIQPTKTLSGHTSFVYSLATLPGGNGELVSAGEDRSVRVWRDGSLVQTIMLPAISVWSVTALPNSDIVAGTSDHIARVFSRDPSRTADQPTLAAYDHLLSSQTLNESQLGDVNKDSLPGPEALATAGTKDGQTKMVKVGDVVEAHSWNSGAGRWDKIGEVVGGVGSGSKKLFEGKEYDYVFDVDIADGVPPLKLPFNCSENPYAAAQRFLEKNDLSQEYIDQVVKFIEQNTQGVSLGGEQYVDPYTGGSRYQPAGGNTGSRAPAPAAAAAAAAAPQTSNTAGAADRYTGSRNVDPYTSSTSSTTTAASSSSPRILPQTQFLAFKTANFGAIRQKLVQTNAQHEAAHKLSDAELQGVLGLVDRLEELQNNAGGTGGRGSESQQQQQLEVGGLIKAVSLWSAAERLPALDLLRCAAVLPTNVSGVELATLAFGACAWADPIWPAVGTAEAKQRDTNSMLALRLLANLYSVPSRLAELQANALSILGSLPDTHVKNLGKNATTALATLVYNATAAMASLGGTRDSNLARILLGLINELLDHELQTMRGGSANQEAVYRVLVALGNLVIATASGLPTPLTDSTRSLVQQAASAFGTSEQRIAQICAEVLGLL